MGTRGCACLAIERFVEKWTVDHLEISWVLESNHLSYKSLARAGCTVDKTYRVYDKAF